MENCQGLHGAGLEQGLSVQVAAIGLSGGGTYKATG